MSDAPENKIFAGTVDTDDALRAAAREAGWALTELVDQIDVGKRGKLVLIAARLANALNPVPLTPLGFQRTVTKRGVRVNSHSYDCGSVPVGTDVYVFLVSEIAVVAHLFSSDRHEYLGEAIRHGSPSPRSNLNIEITQEGFERQAALEGDLEIGAGVPSYLPGFVPSGADRYYNGVIAKLQTQIAALSQSPAQSVRVKPLEWRRGYCDDQVTISQAYTIGGMYQIRVLNGVVWLDKPLTQTIYPTADDAKAAAQADYEASIRAALATEIEPSPAPIRDRLQAIIDWADLATANRTEFDGHGVALLSGEVFDKARAALAAQSPAPRGMGL